MKTPTKKTRTGRCEFCFPQKNAPELGKLPTATIIIDDKRTFCLLRKMLWWTYGRKIKKI